MRYDLQILGAKYQHNKIGFANLIERTLNESTSCVGSFLINPTVSESKKGQVLMTTFRTVVSSVAKVCSLQNITFPNIHQCRFPH
jgi:hypothetical protein